MVDPADATDHASGSDFKIDQSALVNQMPVDGFDAAATGINTSVVEGDTVVDAMSKLQAQIDAIPAEANDLTAAVTWANVPNANITESSVTQHEAALTITESQIGDLRDYVLVSGDTMTGNLGINELTPEAWLHIDTDTGEAMRLSDDGGANVQAARVYQQYYWQSTRMGYAGFSGEFRYEIATDFSDGFIRLRSGSNVGAFTVDSSQRVIVGGDSDTAEGTATIYGGDASDEAMWVQAITGNTSDIFYVGSVDDGEMVTISQYGALFVESHNGDVIGEFKSDRIGLSLFRVENTANHSVGVPIIQLEKSGYTPTVAGEDQGRIEFDNRNGLGQTITHAQISCTSDGTPSGGFAPVRLGYYLSNGSATLYESVRMASGGTYFYDQNGEEVVHVNTTTDECLELHSPPLGSGDCYMTISGDLTIAVRFGLVSSTAEWSVDYPAGLTVISGRDESAPKTWDFEPDGTFTIQNGHLGMWGVNAPTVQPSHITDPSGGATQDAEARTAINSILSVLEGMGATATS